MRRLSWLLALALLLAPLAARAQSLLPTTTITAPVGPVSTQWWQAKDPAIRNVLVQATFVYGSGGTTVDAWLQTSVDGGATAIDIANFHFLLASARKTFNLSSLTPVTTQSTPTDGALAANTAVDGQVGQLFRVKYLTTGTYAGGTTLRVDVSAAGRLTTQVQ